MSASESKSAIVLELAEEFLERYRQGERPPLKEYIDKHPDLAAEIREVFPAMALMEKIALADDSLAGDAASVPPKAPPLQQLGDFRIIREVGHGGMGVVYEAEQVSLGRHVALKLLPQKLLADGKQKRRFEREAKAAARLHHTNIVPVFGVGEHDGMPYYVMQFIQGLGLDEVLDELQRMQPGSGIVTGGELRVARKDVSAEQVARSLMTGQFEPPADAENERDSGQPAAVSATVDRDAAAPLEGSGSGRLSDSFSLSSSSVTLPGQGAGTLKVRTKKQTYWQSIANIGVQLADALGYAHKQGILHRDIKPSNLLLDTRGTVWVTDFGLAKADDQQNLTHTGDILGTLRYMPPEAFEGRTDARSDVYSLGLTLYELLSFRPAFDEKDRPRLIKQVTSSEPPHLDRLNRGIPRDLVTIVHKAMDRDPGHRYPSAVELASDLQRFLDDEPIQARRLSLRERGWRWCRRNPGIASLTAALVLLLIGITVASLLAAGHFNQLASQETQAADNERQAKLAAQQTQEKEAKLRDQAERDRAEADAQRQRAEAFKAAFDRGPQAGDVGEYQASIYENMAALERRLRNHKEAILAYEKANAVRLQLARAQPTNPKRQIDLLEGYKRLADFQHELQPAADSLASWQEGHRWVDQLPGDSPQLLFVQACVRAYCMTLLGPVKDEQAGPDKEYRESEARKTVDALQKAIADGFRDLDWFRTAPDLKDLRERSDFKRLELDLVDLVTTASPDRLKAAREALVQRKKAAEADPSKQRLQADLAAAQHRLGSSLLDATSQLGEARQWLEQALAIRQELVKGEPRNAAYQADLAQTQLKLAQAQLKLGDIYWKAGLLAEGGKARQQALQLLETARQAEPTNADLQSQAAAAHREIADTFGRAGLWKEAAGGFREYLKLQREPQPLEQWSRDWYRTAALALIAGDPAGYKEICTTMLDRFCKSEHPLDVGLVVWACCLASGDDFDTGKLVQLAEKVVAAQPTPWWRDALARAHYRAGQFEQAIARATEAGKDTNWIVELVSWPLLAMAHHRLGHDAEAKRFLEMSREAWRRYSPLIRQLDGTAALPNSLGFNWYDWTAFEVLLREAFLLITKSVPFEEIYGQLHRGHLYARLGQSENAEAEFQAAGAMRLTEPVDLLARARLFVQVGQHARAEADFARASELKPDDPRPWIERGRVLAQRGEQQKADAAFAKAAALTPDELNKFIDAGWWVVGPYPEELTSVCPPEKDPDPSKPVAESLGAGTLRWQWVPTGEFGQVDLLPVSKIEHRSAYALNHVFCPKESPATLLVSADDHVRVWLNGKLVYERLHAWNVPVQRVPVTFCTGRNTLLVKVSNSTGHHSLMLRIGDNTLDRATTFADLGLWEEAVAQFRKVNQLPDDPWNWFHAAYTLLRNGDMPGYRKLCRRMLDKWQASSDANQLNGTARTCLLGRLEPAEVRRAVQAAEKARSLHPHHSGIRFTLAAGHYRAGQYDQAIQWAEESLRAWHRLDKDDRVLNWLLIALAYHQKGQHEQAKAWRQVAELWIAEQTQGTAGQIVDHVPESMAKANWLITQILRREAATLIGGREEDPDDKARQTRLREEMKKLGPDTYDYDLALLLEPREPRFLLARSRRYLELKREAQAAADIARVVEINPRNPAAWRERGRHYAESRQFDQAAADFDKALNLSPSPTGTFPAFPYQHGGADETYDLAVAMDEVFVRLAELRPKDSVLWARRVEHFAESGRWPEAEDALRQTIERFPDEWWAPNLLARLRLYRGDMDGYRALCRQLVERFGGMKDHWAAVNHVRTIYLSPDGLPDTAALAGLVGLVIAGPADNFWMQVTRALTDFRNGDAAGAARRLAGQVRPNPASPNNGPFADTVRTLVYLKLGQTAEARDALAGAKATLARNRPGFDLGQRDDWDWHNRLSIEILVREAEQLIEGKKTDPKK